MQLLWSNCGAIAAQAAEQLAPSSLASFSSLRSEQASSLITRKLVAFGNCAECEAFCANYCTLASQARARRSLARGFAPKLCFAKQAPEGVAFLRKALLLASLQLAASLFLVIAPSSFQLASSEHACGVRLQGPSGLVTGTVSKLEGKWGQMLLARTVLRSNFPN